MTILRRVTASIGLVPEVLEPVRRQLGVAHSVLNLLVAEIGLQRARVVAIIGELVPTPVPQLMCAHLAKARSVT
jgi:hypothetical protein